jgi:hypothetical protein
LKTVKLAVHIKKQTYAEGGRRSLLCWAVALIAVVVGACLTVGCNTQGCVKNRSALPLMGFYANSTQQSIALDSLEMGGVGAPNDSLLISAGDATSSLYFPLRADRNETAFYFHYAYADQGLDNPAFNDTIVFNYTTSPYFESEECGAYYIYTINKLSYTRHLIDSVAIVDSVINNIDMERIKVFFRVSSSDDTAADDDADADADADDADDTEDVEEPDTTDSEVADEAESVGPKHIMLKGGVRR